MFKKRILTALFILGLSATFSSLLAQNKTQATIYSNEFLKIGVGARAMGMGRTMCALTDDVTAGYWNPAGLASASSSMQPEVSLMYASYFANIATYNYAGFVIPVDSTGNRRFGVTLIRLGVDNIPNTLDLVSNGNIDFNKVRSFSTADFATLLSYAWRPKGIKGLSLGTNFKIIYRGVGRFANAWGFGLDVAAKYQVKNFMVGVNLMDATQTYNMWTFNTETFKEAFIQTGNVIPENSVEITKPAARIGLGYNINMGSRFGAVIGADADVTFDGKRNTFISSQGASIDPKLGLEISYKHSNTGKPLASLRGGIFNIQQIEDVDGNKKTAFSPSVGVGFAIKAIKVDYALAQVGSTDLKQASHIVSLSILIPSKNK